LLEGFSSSFQNCIQLASGETTIRAHLHCTERFADAHNALITAVATFLLTIVTLGLILGAVDQQKTTRAKLRAYLLPERATVAAAGANGMAIFPTTQIAVGTQPIAEIRWKNYGPTPAFDVNVAGNVCLTRWPLDPTSFPALDREAGSSQSLGPNGTTTKWEIAETPLILSNADLLQLQTGHLAFVVFGEVTYRDAFNRKHRTRYRLFTGGPAGIRGMSMFPHNEGNDAT
jgi:hypothetical protein